jgi:hypothetical protein
VKKSKCLQQKARIEIPKIYGIGKYRNSLDQWRIITLCSNFHREWIKMLNLKKYIKHLIWLFFLIAGILNAQTLTVSLGDNNHAASYEDGDGSDIVMMQLHLSASADMEITGITVDPTAGGGNNLRRNELVDPEILIYEDMNHNGVLETDIDDFIASADYSALPPPLDLDIPDDPVVVSIPNKTVLNGTDQDWIIVHNFDGADDNNYIRVDVTNVSVASGSATGTPLTGSTKTVESNPASRDGSLFLGEGGANPIGRNISNTVSNEVMLQLVLVASTLEDATITQIDFDMSGSGDESADLTNAKLYLDGDANGILNLEEDTQIGSTVTSFSDNGTLSFTGISEVITAGSAEHWIVVYSLNGNASYGETFILDLTSNSDITTSGITITGAPANGSTATISAKGSLTLSAGANNPFGKTVSALESELSMIQLNLAANATEDIDISSISFKTIGTADESTDIDSVMLINDINGDGDYDILYDSKIGSTVSSFTNNGPITFSGLSETILTGQSENWILVYYLSGDGTPGETFKTYFDATSQVTATGATSDSSISPIGLPVNGNIMTITSIGTITIALAETDPGDENYNGTATDMTMLAITISANEVEDASIDEITLTPETNDLRRMEINGTGNPEIYIYEDVDENGDLNVAIDRLITSDSYTSFLNSEIFVPEAVTIPISGEVIAANSTVQWLVINSITGGSVGDYLEVAILQTGITGTGQTSLSEVSVSGLSVYGGVKTHVSGVPGSLTLSEGSQNPDYRFISGGVQNETMLQFQLSADAIEDIDVSEFKIIMSGTGDESSDLTSVRLFLDGDNNGSLNLLYDTQLSSTITSMTDNDTLTFSSFNDTISSGTAKNYIIVFNFNVTNNEVGENFKALIGNAYVTATGITSTTSIVPTGGPAEGGLATITDTGTLNVSAGAHNPTNANVSNSDDNVTTIQLNIAAGSNENVTITSIKFTLSGTFNDTLDFENASFRLYNDDNGNGAFDTGELQLGTGQNPNNDNGTVTFSGLSETILASTNVNWIVLTNLNGTASDFENFRVSFANSAHLTATGDDTGDPIYPDGAPVQGGLFTVGNVGSLTLAKGSNSPAAGTENPGAQNVEMLQLKLTASGVENIRITSITFTADGTGNDLTDLNDTGNGVSLYRDINNDGQLDGGDTQIDIQRIYSGNNGTVTFTISADTIDAGTSENWLIVYDFDAVITNGTTFRVGIYNASQITSTGVSSGLPITETGFPVVGPYKTIDTVGSLTLFVGDHNPGVSDITEQLDFEMLQFKLEVSTIEDIQVNSLTLTHQGTGNPAGTILPNGVQLVRDINNNGLYDSGTDNILATTNFSGSTATFTLSSIIISADDTENWLVMYDWSPPLTNGQTYQSRFVNLTDIDLTGVTSSESIIADGGVPVAGGTKTANDDYSLPVELVAFTAKGDYGFIELNWETASEIDNLGFELERRLVEDDNFEKIASYRTSVELKGQGSVSYSTKYCYKDSTVIPEKQYTYRLIQYDYNGALEILALTPSATAKIPLPTKYELAQNYPNPFNSETTIKFSLPINSKISLDIYNTLGQKVKTLIDNNSMEAGYYTIKWNGTNENNISVASGVYFYQLRTGHARIVKRLVYAK